MGCYFSYKAKGKVGTGAHVGRKDQVMKNSRSTVDTAGLEGMAGSEITRE